LIFLIIIEFLDNLEQISLYKNFPNKYTCADFLCSTYERASTRLRSPSNSRVALSCTLA